MQCRLHILLNLERLRTASPSINFHVNFKLNTLQTCLFKSSKYPTSFQSYLFTTSRKLNIRWMSKLCTHNTRAYTWISTLSVCLYDCEHNMRKWCSHWPCDKIAFLLKVEFDKVNWASTFVSDMESNEPTMNWWCRW